MGCFSGKTNKKASEYPQAHKLIAPIIAKMNFVKIKQGSLTDNYKIIRKISEGSFGLVRLVVDKISSSKRAVKTLLITSNFDIDKLLEEANILKSLDHPNIIKIYEIIADSRSVNIVMELCTGGELFERINQTKKFTETIAAKYIAEIVSAIMYCHEAHIVHRDLKPENILLENERLDARIKIIDFGNSQYFAPREKLNQLIGTAYYVAPEVIDKNYDEKCDVWSIGVILYIMLCGYPPFNGKSDSDIHKQIKESVLVFREDCWKHISNNAKELITKMLIKNPEARPSIHEIYNDPWIQNRVRNSVPENPIARAALTNLKNFGVISI